MRRSKNEGANNNIELNKPIKFNENVVDINN